MTTLYNDNNDNNDILPVTTAISGNQCPRTFRATQCIANQHWDAGVHEWKKSSWMKQLCTVHRQLQRFGKSEVGHGNRFVHDSGICCHDTRNIGIDDYFFGIQRSAEQRSGVVGTVPSQGRRPACFSGTNETGMHRHTVTPRMPNLLHVGAGGLPIDTGISKMTVGSKPRSCIDVEGVDSPCLQEIGQDKGRQALAKG